MTPKTATTDKKLDGLLRLAGEMLADGRDADAERQYAKAARLAPGAALAHRGLAIVASRRGDAAGAVLHMERAAALAPQAPALRAEYARMLILGGRANDALREFQAALALAPRDAETWHYYGVALLRQAQPAAAVDAFRQALMLVPRPDTLEQAARTLQQLGRPDEALPLWRTLVESAPANVSYALGLAQAAWESGDVDAALRRYAEAAARFPDAPDVAMAQALTLEDRGDRDGAEREFRRALALRPGWPYALGSLLELVKGRAEPSLVETAERQFADPALPDTGRALLGFGLGKVRESKQDYAGAFAAWEAANAARRRLKGPLDRDALVQRVDRLIAVFDAAFLEARREWGSADGRPVFIVGMPRSGTTLVEQVIAAHPAAAACGELPDLARIATGLRERIGTLLPWPEAARALTAPVARDAAARYLQALEKRVGTGARRVTDKAPLNFFHVGLIALLFPQARIVWCRRDPRDVCLSIFSENFAVQQTYATSLDDIAFYQRQQERLMRHWQALRPGAIEPLVYEELVAGFEPRVRRLLDFLGLPFAAECLEFHRHERAVLTPSRWQVRQPLYAGSVGRWKRFEPWLAPLLRALEEGA